jgi:hypothetical protein
MEEEPLPTPNAPEEERENNKNVVIPTFFYPHLNM